MYLVLFSLHAGSIKATSINCLLAHGINKKVKRRNKMQKLDMSSYGVEELDANEMKISMAGG